MTSCADVLAGRAPKDAPVTLRGWVRTRRDSKAGFSFLELNDGSSLANVQVIADSSLPNYQTEIAHLSAGSSVTVTGVTSAMAAARSS